jgi:hypothetical protein
MTFMPGLMVVTIVKLENTFSREEGTRDGDGTEMTFPLVSVSN